MSSDERINLEQSHLGGQSRAGQEQATFGFCAVLGAEGTGRPLWLKLENRHLCREGTEAPWGILAAFGENQVPEGGRAERPCLGQRLGIFQRHVFQ